MERKGIGRISGRDIHVSLWSCCPLVLHPQGRIRGNNGKWSGSGRMARGREAPLAVDKG